MNEEIYHVLILAGSIQIFSDMIYTRTPKRKFLQ